MLRAKLLILVGIVLIIVAVIAGSRDFAMLVRRIFCRVLLLARLGLFLFITHDLLL
jgi:hypothetical protein